MWCATAGVNAGARRLAINMRRDFASASTTMLGGGGTIADIAGIGATNTKDAATGATACGSRSDRYFA